MHAATMLRNVGSTLWQLAQSPREDRRSIDGLPLRRGEGPKVEKKDDSNTGIDSRVHRRFDSSSKEFEIAFVTFGSESFYDALRRVRAQARKSHIFDHVWINRERNLPRNFREIHGPFLESSKSYGYWIWKPQIILQALEKLKWGDILLYVDAGVHLDPAQRIELESFLLSARNAPSGCLASQLDFPERDWTKRDTLLKLDVSASEDVLDTGQIQSGALVFVKSETTLELVRDWLFWCTNDYSMVDDSPSSLPEADSFKAHRHDQSVLSILAKRFQVETFPASLMEQWRLPEIPPRERFPLQARRDRKGPIRKMKKRLRRFLRGGRQAPRQWLRVIFGRE